MTCGTTKHRRCKGISVWVSQDEYLLIKQAAESHGLYVNEYIRARLAGHDGITFAPRDGISRWYPHERT